MLQKKRLDVKKLLGWLVLWLFIAVYPMMLSIYLFLPLFIGVAGYMLLVGLEDNRIGYILAAMLYLVNLDVNLSLPFWLIFFAVFPVYWFVFPVLKALQRCPQCKAFISILLIDMLFLLTVKGYDFVMQTDTVAVDSILFFTLIVDLIVAVLL